MATEKSAAEVPEEEAATVPETTVTVAAKKAAKRAPSKKATAKKTGTVRKSTAKKAASKSGGTKEITVKVIQTLDFAPGRDITVYFTDGTKGTVPLDSDLYSEIRAPELLAPNLIQVTMSKGIVSEVEKVVT